MTILGIETSCDETSTAILSTDSNNQITILSQNTATSVQMHAKTGGIIPEVAAREQSKYMLPVILKTLEEGVGFDNTQQKVPQIDAIAVTYGPGLIGSLLVGVETARTLSFLWDIPLIPVNHLHGHIYANWITTPNIDFPAIALVVSGGHTDLVLLQTHNKIKLLGGTRDDAAGEAFDKIARLLDLPYPGGPSIERLSKKTTTSVTFPRPLIGEKTFDFSFSGLKTAVLREVKKKPKLTQREKAQISLGVIEAIVSVLVRKTVTAAKKYNAKSILLGGGVAANDELRKQLKRYTQGALPSAKIFAPAKNLCTDNGAMIAAAAVYHNKPTPWRKVQANPELYFDE